MQVSSGHLQCTPFWSISVFTLLVGIGYLALLQFNVVPVDSDQEMLSRNDKFQDWDLPVSQLKMVQLAELINRTLAHLPSEFLPEYKNPCWCANAHLNASWSLRCIPYFFLISFPRCGTMEICQLNCSNSIPRLQDSRRKRATFL